MYVGRTDQTLAVEDKNFEALVKILAGEVEHWQDRLIIGQDRLNFGVTS
jgi:hypothetical protein